MSVARMFAALLGTVVLLAATLTAQATGVSPSDSATAAGYILLTQDGVTRDLAIEEIERLPTVEIQGNASPDEPVTTFRGVLLSDLVEMIGAGEAEGLIVRASDGYSADIPREDWERWPIVVATRVGQERLTLRQRGPARIVYPIARYPELDGRTYVDRSVWLIVEIEW
ncbi:hypothetical protein [Stappia sp. WLB 29]|uniref:hypothetical protein n=1 Tax=Stappia sp. WLB 29 TaxID=2925220 RepID=UPI0020BE556F|nr:hypothetical protein [Stappia sp. WLB 29]